MSAEYTSLVDTFPTASLQTAFAFIRGQPVSKPDIALAAVNVISYAASLFVGDGGPTPMFAAVSAAPVPSQEEAEAAFADVLPDDSGTMKAGDRREAFITIVKTLLPILLKLLV